MTDAFKCYCLLISALRVELLFGAEPDWFRPYLDRLWTLLSDEEKERVPRIPFRTVG